MSPIPQFRSVPAGLGPVGARARSLAKAICWGALLCLVLNPGSLRACTMCYGQSDSPLAHGLNWGILSLLAVVATVLGSFAAFFIYLAHRAAVTPPTPAAEQLLASAKEI